MTEAVASTPAAHTLPVGGSLHPRVHAAALYADAAYQEHLDYGEGGDSGELFYDVISMLLRAAEGRYVEGLAQLAARKRQPGYMVARLGLDRAESIIASIAPETPCSETLESLAEAAKILEVEEDAAREIIALASGDCGVARHALGLLLLVPPLADGARGVEEGAIGG